MPLTANIRVNPAMIAPITFVPVKKLRHESYRELLELVLPPPPLAPNAAVGIAVLKIWEIAKVTDSLLAVVVIVLVSSIVSGVPLTVVVNVSVISRVNGTSTSTTEIADWVNSMTETAVWVI